MNFTKISPNDLKKTEKTQGHCHREERTFIDKCVGF